MSSNEGELQEQARTVAGQVEDVKGISRLDKIIKRAIGQAKNIAINPPEYQEIFSDNSLSELVDRISGIVAKYQEDEFDFDPVVGGRDALKLASLLVNYSMKVGALQGLSTHFEHNRKMAMAKNAISAINGAEEEELKITNAEAEAIGRSMSETATFYASQSEMASRVATNFLFSVRHFLDILNNALTRQSRENMAGI